MNILACDGPITIDQSGSPVCPGDWLSVTASELAYQANTLSSADFRLIAGYCVLWFVLAFGIKVIRRTFNV